MSHPGILGTASTLIAVTTILIISRSAAIFTRTRRLRAEDYLLFLGYLLLLAQCSLLIYLAPSLPQDETAKFEQFEEEQIANLQRIQKCTFALLLMLWLCLWAVKFSLLAMYRRFLNRKWYICAWRVLVGICALTLVHCIVTICRPCSPFSPWYTQACDNDQNVKLTWISAYIAYAHDILTDLLVMLLPTYLIWNLSIHPSRKRVFGALVSLGWLCIAAATLRLIQIIEKAKETGFNPKWSLLWGVIEAGVAVTIGCCPGIYRGYRRWRERSRSRPMTNPASYRFDALLLQRMMRGGAGALDVPDSYGDGKLYHSWDENDPNLSTVWEVPHSGSSGKSTTTANRVSFATDAQIVIPSPCYQPSCTRSP
ncbi:hypothetical protein BDV25DRAFT_137994 [Aspergillus avenaceus]|uniref:Rhodopsin domain-containing protein n=1 Tax=Aspergillus avenaceus TaxID=36643 RepID=A0A5N6U131_ASPAV|nr:hypothetical protein BDV25DRAFT_137994 [Aspergillus avenaceus]